MSDELCPLVECTASTVAQLPCVVCPHYAPPVRLPSILDEFNCSPECFVCMGEGIVCENHPDRAWPMVCDCGAGMPCPSIAKAREVFGGDAT